MPLPISSHSEASKSRSTFPRLKQNVLIPILRNSDNFSLNTMKTLRHQNDSFLFIRRALVILLSLIGIILVNQMTDSYLRINFSNNGEAYWKGAGHLLNENLPKGLFFIISRQFLPPFFLFVILFSMIVNDIARKILFKYINVLAIVILILTSIFILYKTVETYPSVNDQLYKIIEMSLNWYLKVFGFYIGYLITRIVF